MSLWAQKFNEKDFVAVGVPILLSKDEFSNSYAGPLNLDVSASPNGESFLIMIDVNKMDADGKMVACWVLDQDMELRWKAMHGVAKNFPGQDPYSAVALLDDGSVVLNARTWNGKMNKALEECTTTMLVRLNGTSRSEWSRSLSGGSAMCDVGWAVKDEGIHVGGFVVNDEKKSAVTEWSIVALNEDLNPSELARGKMKGEGYKDAVYSALAIDPQGGYFIIGTLDDSIVILSIAADGKVRWEKAMRSKRRFLPDMIVRDGSLYLAMMAHASDLISLKAGKGFENAGFQQQPILLSFSETGDMTFNEIIPAKDGGTRDVINHGVPDFSDLSRYGAFVDLSHDKDRPGVVKVEMK